MTGRIFDIGRFYVDDGPGIRTVVFLKGCYLRCLWCENPESQNPAPSLSWLPAKCIGCGDCVEICPESALAMTAGENGKQIASLNRAKCTACGKCAEVCEPKALEMVGRDVTVDEVLSVVLRDRKYYDESGGGMTVSGGGPLFQPKFTEALVKGAKKHGLHCCIETAGFAPWSDLQPLAELVDLFLYDWKETNPELHKKFTGRSNVQIRA